MQPLTSKPLNNNRIDIITWNDKWRFLKIYFCFYGHSGRKSHSYQTNFRDSTENMNAQYYETKQVWISSITIVWVTKAKKKVTKRKPNMIDTPISGIIYVGLTRDREQKSLLNLFDSFTHPFDDFIPYFMWHLNLDFHHSSFTFSFHSLSMANPYFPIFLIRVEKLLDFYQ